MQEKPYAEKNYQTSWYQQSKHFFSSSAQISFWKVFFNVNVDLDILRISRILSKRKKDDDCFSKTKTKPVMKRNSFLKVFLKIFLDV